MNVQIYVTHADDAELCDSVGVDLIGVVVDPAFRTPSSLDFLQAEEAFSRVSSDKSRVALSMDSSTEAFLEIVEILHPDILHIACDLKLLSPNSLCEIRSRIQDTNLMLAIPMNGPDPIGLAREFEKCADYFILDTGDPDRVDIGATGQTHDWNLSAKLVQEVSTPTVLAGGLSPENVAEAIQVVKPWGVDSFTKTNRTDLPLRKDPDQVISFVKAARPQ